MRNEETVIPGKQRRLSDRYKLPTPFCFSAIIGVLSCDCELAHADIVRCC